MMISELFENAGGPPFAINGSISRPPLAVTAGVPQRLRLADLTLSGENLVVSLSERFARDRMDADRQGWPRPTGAGAAYRRCHPYADHR
jgi:hypothetical protein